MGTSRFPFAVSLMILFITTNLWATIAFEVVFNTNTTSFGVAIGEEQEEEEFLMESEVSRRLLAAPPVNPLSYNALKTKEVCNAKIYGNCIKPISGNNRPCTYYNRCKRAGS
ncbi:protein RALF-like 27 [Mangifera indica]|uniref:protein RALF-like 27 n=1 Tax=Mangifera indica TaxID=29780 RepID=UPI001CFAC873|nr:protein RALF-like 27 [Mangifera indica]